MAVIKSGSSTDQLDITAGKAAKVALYNADGTVASLSFNANVSTLAQETGNLAVLRDDDINSIIPLLTAIRMELRIMNKLILEISAGNDIRDIDLDREYRQDPYYSNLSGPF